MWRLRSPSRIVAGVFAASIVGTLAGLAAALFLALLDLVTTLRTTQPILVLLLPVIGLGMGALLSGRLRVALDGAAQVNAALRETGPVPPLHLVPVVLFGSVLTHLGGGSAGREGAAVQMGATLGGFAMGRLSSSAQNLASTGVLAGTAGGFGAIFGTPLAGLIFALEIARRRRLSWFDVVVSCAAAVIGDQVAQACGATHTIFPILDVGIVDLALVGQLLALGVAVGAVALLFQGALHLVKVGAARTIPSRSWRMAAGGVLVIALSRLQGDDTSLGLGVPVIVQALTTGDVESWAWLWKLVMTAVTIGTGFLGGEVTPLFFIGASFGQVASMLLQIPTELAAGLAMVALFGACAGAPVALAVMAAELFGPVVLLPAGVVCVVAAAVTQSVARRVAMRSPTA